MATKNDNSSLLGWLIGGAALLWFLHNNALQNALASDPLAGTAAASRPATFLSEEDENSLWASSSREGLQEFDASRPLVGPYDSGPAIVADDDEGMSSGDWDAFMRQRAQSQESIARRAAIQAYLKQSSEPIPAPAHLAQSEEPPDA